MNIISKTNKKSKLKKNYKISPVKIRLSKIEMFTVRSEQEYQRCKNGKLAFVEGRKCDFDFVIFHRLHQVVQFILLIGNHLPLKTHNSQIDRLAKIKLLNFANS